jgi:hypothetical protein
MSERGVDRQVVDVALGIRRRELRIVDHQLGAFGQRTVALVTANAALRRPRSGARHDSQVAARMQQGGQVFSETHVTMGDQDAVHGRCPLLATALVGFSFSASRLRHHAPRGGLSPPFWDSPSETTLHKLPWRVVQHRRELRTLTGEWRMSMQLLTNERVFGERHQVIDTCGVVASWALHLQLKRKRSRRYCSRSTCSRSWHRRRTMWRDSLPAAARRRH